MILTLIIGIIGVALVGILVWCDEIALWGHGVFRGDMGTFRGRRHMITGRLQYNNLGVWQDVDPSWGMNFRKNK